MPLVLIPLPQAVQMCSLSLVCFPPPPVCFWVFGRGAEGRINGVGSLDLCGTLVSFWFCFGWLGWASGLLGCGFWEFFETFGMFSPLVFGAFEGHFWVFGYLESLFALELWHLAFQPSAFGFRSF